MYRIDHASNRIMRVQRVSFSELGFTERHHLQEWLANQPDALGEELLVIQKEFDGFDDTRERLDLLAIDKEGNLVVIENKLDDSGRDVVWQALKYASYCSSLKKAQVANIFQRYLDKTRPGQVAESVISEFLGKEDFSEVALNLGSDQRVILVAAQFRKEVTSTVLWLLKHNVRLKCFLATPYRDGQDVFLTVDQVIPLPQAEELMIGMSEKEADEQVAERGLAARQQLRIDFWHETLEALTAAGIDLYENVSPGKDHWLNAGSGLGGVAYSMIFNRDEVRVGFILNQRSRDVNKEMFDYLVKHKDAIEARFGGPLNWRRMDDNKQSIIECGESVAGHDRSQWAGMIQWLVPRVKAIEAAFGVHVSALRKIARARVGEFLEEGERQE